MIKLLIKLLHRILKLQTVRDSAPRIVVCPGANPPCGVVGVSVLRSHAIRDRSVQILSKLVAVDLPAFSLTRAQHVQGMLLVLLRMPLRLPLAEPLRMPLCRLPTIQVCPVRVARVVHCLHINCCRG